MQFEEPKNERRERERPVNAANGVDSEVRDQ